MPLPLICEYFACVFVHLGPKGLRDLICVCVRMCVYPLLSLCLLARITLQNEVLFAICLGANLLIAKLDVVNFQILLCDWGYISLAFLSGFSF